MVFGRFPLLTQPVQTMVRPKGTLANRFLVNDEQIITDENYVNQKQVSKRVMCIRYRSRRKGRMQ